MGNPYDDPNLGLPAGTAPYTNPYDDPDLGKHDSIPRRIADLGVSLAKNVPSVGQTGYQLADVATGGALDRASTAFTGKIADLATSVGDAITGNKVGQIYKAPTADAMFAPNDQSASIPGEKLSAGFDRVDETIGSLYSDDQKAANQRVSDAKGFFGTAKALVQNPSVILNDAVGSIPISLGMMGGVRALAMCAGSAAAEAAAAKGLGQAEVAAARNTAIDEFSTGKAGMLAQSGTDFAVSGAQQGAQAKQAIEALSDDELAQSPMYQQLRKTMSDADARDKLASNGQFRAFVTAGILSALTSPISSTLEGKAATAGLRDQAAQKAARAALGIKEIGKSIGTEGLQETLQSGGEQIGTNVGMQVVDPNYDLSKDVANQAIRGGAAGGLMGGAFHFAGHADDVVHTAEGIPIDPTTGPLSAAAALSIRSGTDPSLALPGPTTVYPGGPMLTDADGSTRPATYADMSRAQIRAGQEADDAQNSRGLTDNHLQHLQDLGHTYPLAIAQQAATMLEERSGTPMSVAQAPNGRFAALPTNWMSDSHRAENADVQPSASRLALPNPDRPTGGFIADIAAGIRPATARDDTIRRNTQATIDEQRAADIASGNTQDVRDANKRRLGEIIAQRRVNDSASMPNETAGTAQRSSIRPTSRTDTAAAIDQAAHDSATSPLNDTPAPSDAQIEASNYRMGHVRLHGLDISIENPIGSTRSGTDENGRAWSSTIKAGHYGYIRSTRARDGDHIDAFVGPNPASTRVFVVDQATQKARRFDESKVLFGFDTADQARAAYLANHEHGWKGLQALTETNVGDFKRFLANGATKAPFAMQARMTKGALKGIEAIAHPTEAKPTTTRAASRDAARRSAGDQHDLLDVDRTATQTPAFRKWFSDSKVVDEHGDPQVLYHVATQDFDAFRTSGNRTASGDKLDAAFFTPDADYVHAYAAEKRGSNPRTVAAYVALSNPMHAELSARDFSDPRREQPIIEQARAAGHDGVIFTNESNGDRMYAAFRPEQIKSATGNSGAFDPSSASILADRRPAVSTRSAVDDAILTGAREGTTAKPLLERIAKDSATPFNRLLARALLDSGVNSTVNAGTAAGHRFKYSDLNAAAAYRPSADHVTLFTDRNSEKHLLHELTHAATVNAIREGGRHAEELDRLVREVRESGEIDATLYGLRDNYEFIAEAFSNPAFQSELRNVYVTPGSKLSVWDSFVNLVKRILGIKDGTALAEAMRIGANLMRENRLLGRERTSFADASMADVHMPEIVANLREKFSDHFNTQKTVSWWHKTVGTMYHFAQVNPQFKTVFDLGQRFLQDTSQIAMNAADLAPNILPKLGTLRDVFRAGLGKKDADAVAKAFFQGTREGERYDDATLASRFALTPDQIDVFHEARAAVDRMLDETLASEVARVTRRALDSETRAAMKANPRDAARIAIEALGSTNPDLSASIQEKTANMQKLKDEGYAPLSRFGQYTVYAVDKEGRQLYYDMRESEADAAALARTLKANFPDAIVTQGVLSQESFKSFQGTNPDTLELFAHAMGVDADEAFQSYIAKAVNNRSTLKRLAHRKTGADGLSGLEGFSEDLPRVLASFVTSGARMASKNYSMIDMLEAVQAIPKENGDVIDMASKLHAYLLNPMEEMPALRGYLFTHFIGGSIASAMTNMTQPVLQTFPYLAQWGTVRAGKELTDAARIAATNGKVDPDMAAALARAERDGVLAPHELHQLYSESIRGFGSNPVLRRGLKVWGSFFSLAEAFNRKATFIAAYRVGATLDGEALQKAGVTNAFDFAEKAIHETQGIYNRGNRPQWARGAIGATLFTFKQFSVSYLEFLKRLPPKQRHLALAILVMAAGTQGLPFAEDLEDIIDTLGQSLGYDTNSKEALRNAAVKYGKALASNVLGDAAASILGENFGNFVINGASSLPGVPLDVQGRLGLSNLIPGTAVFKPSNKDKLKEAFEALGPVGSFVTGLTSGVTQAQAGDLAGVARGVLPVALQNAMKALDMEMTGAYRNGRGQVVTKTTDLDAVMKGIGFQPQDVARAQLRLSGVYQDRDLNEVVKGQIMNQWANGMFENDPVQIRDAVQALAAWNRKNPESPIQIVPASVMAKVREMAITADVRTIKGSPKILRGQVAAELR